MPNVALLKQDGTQAGNIELNDSVFGIEPHKHALHETVVMQRASLRQGTHDVKGRSEVRGGGRKPWRQKGTGRARQGSNRAPQWVGGGTVFGPTPRSYSYKIPKKVRRLALRSAFSSKIKDGEAVVLENIAIDAPKTKEVVKMLGALNVDTKALIVTEEKDENIVRSVNNLPHAQVLTVDDVSVLDLLTYDKLIITKGAADKAGEVLAQ